MLNDKIYLRPRKWAYFISVVLVIVLVLTFKSAIANSLSRRISGVEINGSRVEVELAVTDNEKDLGLAGRPFLSTDTGMLFLYNKPTQPAFWMRGMKFPIDIIWISKGRVADLTLNLEVPKTKPLPTYSLKSKIDAVLEVNAGWVKLNDVKVGDKVIFRY